MKRRMLVAGVVGVGALALAACSSDATTSGQAVTTTTAKTASSSGSTTTTAPTPKGVYPLGTTVKVPVTFDGIDSVLVTAVYPNATSESQFDTPDAGTTYFAADATECAGPKGSNTGAHSNDFSLLLSNGSTAQTSFIEGPLTQAPTLNQLGGSNNSLAAGQCDRGYIVWEVPTGTTPTYVQFSGTTASLTQGNTVVKWPAS